MGAAGSGFAPRLHARAGFRVPARGRRICLGRSRGDRRGRLAIDTFRPYHLRSCGALAVVAAAGLSRFGPLATLLALMAAVGWGSQRPDGGQGGRTADELGAVIAAQPGPLRVDGVCWCTGGCGARSGGPVRRPRGADAATSPGSRHSGRAGPGGLAEGLVPLARGDGWTLLRFDSPSSAAACRRRAGACACDGGRCIGLAEGGASHASGWVGPGMPR